MCISGMRNRLLLVFLSVFFSVQLLSAQDQDQRKRRKAQEVPFKTFADVPSKKWLEEDVRWIITDQERTDFKTLTTAKQRDDFIEAFWERRNLTPGSTENPYKEQHYRRIAYANTRFAAEVPGWKTDRGRFYIMYGPPDSVDSKSGITPPTETWYYLFLEGVGRNVVLTFTDKCACGKYELSGGDSDPRVPRIYDPLRQ
jgi:GWxTD domain-containing protein